MMSLKNILIFVFQIGILYGVVQSTSIYDLETNIVQALNPITNKIQVPGSITATNLSLSCEGLLDNTVCLPHGCNRQDEDLKDLCNNLTMPALNTAGAVVVHGINVKVFNDTQPLNQKPCDFLSLIAVRHCCAEMCMSTGHVTNGKCDYSGNYVYPFDTTPAGTYNATIIKRFRNATATNTTLITNIEQAVLAQVNRVPPPPDVPKFILTSPGITPNRTGACFCSGQGTPDICNLINQENKGHMMTWVTPDLKVYREFDGYDNEFAKCQPLCNLNPYGCNTVALASDGISFICVCYCPTPAPTPTPTTD